jgi:hypothetical protein
MTTRAGPVLVVIEDIHWADRATIGLLRQVIHSDLESFVLLATFRNTELDRVSSLSGFLADLWREPSVSRIDLEGLSPTETAALVNQTTGSAPDEHTISILSARTNGNPFYLLQLQRGDISLTNSSGLSTSLREVILDRVAKLGTSSRGTMDAAAILGTEFDSAVLVQMLRNEDQFEKSAEVERFLVQAEHSRLLLQDPGGGSGYRFSHELVRENLLEQIAPARRAQLHEAAANAILACSNDESALPASELAGHFAEAAVLGEREPAARWALAAAAQALARMAPDDAIALVEQGLAFVEEGESALKLELLLIEVDAQAIRMDLDRHRRALFAAVAAARQLRDPASIARAIDRDTVLPVMGTIDEELLALKQEVLAALGQEPSVQRTRVLLSSVYQRTIGGEGWAAADQAREALADARSLGDSESLAAALYAVASSTLGQPNLKDQLEVAAELMELSDRNADMAPERHGLRFRALLALIAGDRHGFNADADALDRFAAQSSSTFLQSLIGEWRVMQALLDGRIEAAETLANAVLGIAGDDPNFLLGWLVEMIAIRTYQGRVAELVPLADTALAEHPDLDALRALVAGAHLAAGNPVRARSLAIPLIADQQVHLRVDWLRPAALAYLTPVVASTMSGAESLALAEELRPYEGQLLVAGAGALVAGAADHCRARLLAAAHPNQPDEPLKLFARSLELADRTASPTLLTDIRIDFAVFLLERDELGAADEASVLLDEARDSATRCGLRSSLTALAQLASRAEVN